MQSQILFTANPDTSSLLMNSDAAAGLLHLPLEVFTGFSQPEEHERVINSLNSYTFIIHGNLRNARFFTEWMKNQTLLKQVQNRINLAIDKPTAHFLEQEQIPAILFRDTGKPIDVLEFMLRISRQGKTLYPTSENKTEEMPGLLKELDMPVDEFTVCREVTLSSDRLTEYQSRVHGADLKAILFHHRSSIMRIKTAFPALDFNQYKLISGSPGVTEKLREEGYLPDIEADGSWFSIADVIEEISGISA
jgi:uroporphyrinogen-III synthase